MARYLYSELASVVQARLNCDADLQRLRNSGPNNDAAIATRAEWLDKHSDRITQLVADHMPSGSGFDCGTKLDLDHSHADKLVFTTSYHHMNDGGYYDGWTEHTITVTPAFSHFHMRISGRNRNDIKDYITDEFHRALNHDLQNHDLQPEYDWTACQTRYGCALDSRWLSGGSIQEWFVLDNGVCISPMFKDYISARAWAVSHYQEVSR